MCQPLPPPSQYSCGIMGAQTNDLIKSTVSIAVWVAC